MGIFDRPVRFLRQCGAALCALALLHGAMAAVPAPGTSSLRFSRLSTFSVDDKPVSAMLQDRQSFVWIGTAAGLVRYDGYSAVQYTTNPDNPASLPSNRVASLFEDSKGRLWVGTFDGLARYNAATDDFTRFALGTNPGKPLLVQSIVSDGKDGLWLATFAGLQHFDPESGTFRQFLHREGEADSLGSDTSGSDAVAVDAKGGVWVSTWPKGLDYLPAGSTSFQHFSIDPDAASDTQSNYVRALHVDRQQRLWIGTGDGVFRWQTGGDWRTRTRVAMTRARVAAFHEDREGGVWAATWTAGLLYWAPGSDTLENFAPRSNDPHSLHTAGVGSVLRDRTGTLWVGSLTAGIEVANLGSHGFRRYILNDGGAPDAGTGQAVDAISAAPDGHLWLGLLNGLQRWDPASGAVLQYYQADAKRAGALASPVVHGVYQAEGGPLWIATAAGLHRMDKPGGPFKAYHFGEGANDMIKQVVPGAGGKLWVATSAAVIAFNPADGSARVYAPEKDNPNSRRLAGASAIREDSLGRVWMGSEWTRGLEMLDTHSGTFHYYMPEPGKSASLLDYAVTSLHEDSKGRLWAGTGKGLDEIVTAADGTVSFRSHVGNTGGERVYAITSEANGRLWLSTDVALVRYDPDTGQVQKFGARDGLIDSFKVGAAFRAADGALYFAGPQGVLQVRPDQVRLESIAPPLAITDISVANRSLIAGLWPAGVRLTGSLRAPQALELAPGQSAFAIEFSALHFVAPQLNRYAYRLVGFDKDWVPADAAHRRASYTNLPPGDYRFEVTASNNQGAWNQKPLTLAITILPPLWQTWWFRLLAVALAVSLLSLAYRLRVRALQQSRAQLKAEVAARTAELEQSNRMLGESNAKLAAQSTTDSLTGITNRRGFDAALEEEWARAKRAGTALAVAMLDVDLFKCFNDLYGHQAGDQCLRAVAEVLDAHARRRGDQAARYGGEEFVLLLACHGEDALVQAEDVCRSLAALAIVHGQSPFGIVTASIGVAAVVPAEGGTPQGLVEQADQAMYLAKHAGRNCVRLAAG